MRTSNVILATLAATAVFSLSTTADAARGRQAHNQATSRIDIAALPAYPLGNTAGTYGGKGAHARKAFGSHRRSTLDANGSVAPSMSERTLSGYANQPAHTVSPSEAGRRGLVTVDVAGGHRITVSQAFSAPVTALIADLDAKGYRFTRIKCFANHGEGHHKSKSNHWNGDACDFFGSHPPAEITRAHGLRSGCDFHDCMHVDNARNVGGVAYWNSVRHNGTVSASAERRHYRHRRVRLAGRQASIAPTTTTFSARGRHSDGCSRHGDAHGINCQLARWVHCSGAAVRATTFSANSRRKCKAVSETVDGVYIIADKHKACGERISITNATTGKSVNATVGDRGPGTIAVYDLSHKTAAAIGICGSGCVYAGGGLREAGAQ